MHANDNFKYKNIRKMNAGDDLEMGFWLIENNLKQIQEWFSREDIQGMVKGVLIDVKAIEEVCLNIIRRK